jgi:hypothetical protein
MSGLLVRVLVAYQMAPNISPAGLAEMIPDDWQTTPTASS